jgi:hypothetical protein
MQTYTAEISVGGPAYGFPFSAYVKGIPGVGINEVVGLGETPETAAMDARELVEIDAERRGYSVRITFGTEN